MSASLSAAEWKGEERTGKVSQQAGFPFISIVSAPSMAPAAFVCKATAVGAIRYAAQTSGHDDFEIADALAMSHGYMSKVMHGTAGLHGQRLVNFMRVTGSLAPLQWLAEQMGCDVVQRDSRAAEIAELQSRLNELQRRTA